MISSPGQTKITSSESTPGDVVSNWAIISWHSAGGSTQEINANQPASVIAPVLVKTIVKHPVGLVNEAITGSVGPLVPE